MATTATKQFLSESTNGRGVNVVATSSEGTTIHTTPAGTTTMDEIWLWASNISTSDVKLTIEWGGTTAAGDHTEITIPAEAGEELVVAGRLLNNGLPVKAFAGTTAVINLFGHANRITN